jgi:hypothetical protein
MQSEYSSEYLPSDDDVPASMEGVIDVPRDFLDEWDRLMDIEVTFRRVTKPLRDWCYFNVTVGHPECALGILDAPADGSTGYQLSYSVEQSDKSIFMYLMTTACKMARVPSVVVVCETLGNTKDVEGKMNGLSDAIRNACAAGGADVPDLSDTRFMDGVEKNWDALDLGPFCRGEETIVVPGTYLPAIRCLVKALRASGVRPIVFVDEGDKLFRQFFTLQDPQSELAKNLAQMFQMARVVNVVTATPSAFLRWGQLNRLRFRAFVADVDRLRQQNYEVGDNCVLHPGCVGLEENDFDKLSGWTLPVVKQAFDELHALSLTEGTCGLLAQVRRRPRPLRPPADDLRCFAVGLHVFDARSYRSHDSDARLCRLHDSDAR